MSPRPAVGGTEYVAQAYIPAPDAGSAPLVTMPPVPVIVASSHPEVLGHVAAELVQAAAAVADSVIGIAATVAELRADPSGDTTGH
jgi:hypothetical protein